MDFSPLEKIYTADGPFVSAYLDTHEDAEDGAARRETAWKNAARTLIDDGADGATVDAMTQAVLGPRPQGGARVLIASHGHVHLATWLPERRGGADLALVAELPRLLPLIEARADRIPHVVVLTDRLGADVLAFTEGDRPIDIKSTGDVAPWPVHKTGTGGWAAKRFDATVEEDWHRGAEQVAALVEKVSRDTQARLVIASGDERAITLLRQHLPHDLADNLAVVPGGGRRADGGDDVLARHVEEVVLEFAAREHSEIAERFTEAMGRGQGARAGTDDVVEAFQLGEVDTLLLAESARDADQTLAFGPEPQHVADTPELLAALGVEDIRTAPLVDVLVRAAIGSGADIRVLSDDSPHAPDGGIGALLRFDVTTPTPPAV